MKDKEFETLSKVWIEMKEKEINFPIYQYPVLLLESFWNSIKMCLSNNQIRVKDETRK